MDINELLDRVSCGSEVKADFINKRIYLNGRKVSVKTSTVANAYKEIEKLYANYKHSYPSERSHSTHEYFKALTSEELSLEELVNGEERTLARARLEVNFLCWVLNGSLKWQDNRQWFWQSKADPELVILKEWVL